MAKRKLANVSTLVHEITRESDGLFTHDSYTPSRVKKPKSVFTPLTKKIRRDINLTAPSRRLKSAMEGEQMRRTQYDILHQDKLNAGRQLEDINNIGGTMDFHKRERHSRRHRHITRRKKLKT
jgi:hypothetical protein